MLRRRFLFWTSFAVFSLGERLQAQVLDGVAASILPKDDAPATHWRAANNSTWQWYERETLVDGRWMRTGITLPINRKTGEPHAETKGYLDPGLVPSEARLWDVEDVETKKPEAEGATTEHRADPSRRARHGRPPSKWLRSLRAEELRVWLKTVDAPEALVSGMTYWTHLTRDHFFDADRIEGLTIDEQAKLHAAAHHGY